jgi:hypothetical protein
MARSVPPDPAAAGRSHPPDHPRPDPAAPRADRAGTGLGRPLLAVLLLGRLAGAGVMFLPVWQRSPAPAPSTPPTLARTTDRGGLCISAWPCGTSCGSAGHDRMTGRSPFPRMAGSPWEPVCPCPASGEHPSAAAHLPIPAADQRSHLPGLTVDDAAQDGVAYPAAQPTSGPVELMAADRAR